MAQQNDALDDLLRAGSCLLWLSLTSIVCLSSPKVIKRCCGSSLLTKQEWYSGLSDFYVECRSCVLVACRDVYMIDRGIQAQLVVYNGSTDGSLPATNFPQTRALPVQVCGRYIMGIAVVGGRCCRFGAEVVAGSRLRCCNAVAVLQRHTKNSYLKPKKTAELVGRAIGFILRGFLLQLSAMLALHVGYASSVHPGFTISICCH